MSVSGRVVNVRRIYEPASPDDGYRVLVDGIWPRGLRKADASMKEWCRGIAPSTELRRWYGHDPDRFDTFRSRYLAELDDPAHAEALDHLLTVPDPKLTLLTSTKDVRTSHAQVVADRLSDGRSAGGPPTRST